MRSAAARPDSIRRHNLGLLLDQIHRDGPLTRAELTQRLGVNRSTIAALTADLIELGWVQEQAPTTEPERAGRPSIVVTARDGGPYVVAIDVSVEHITVAAVGLGGRVLYRDHAPITPGATTAPAAALVVADLVAGAARRLRALPLQVGVAVPGAVSARDERVAFAPNLDWRDEPFAADVRAALAAAGVPAAGVTIANDANLAAWAETVRGSARGFEDVAYLLGRVGVGAGLIVDGRPLAGAFGLAGEAGHIVLDPAGPRCHCGNRGCVETFIGDGALVGAPDSGWAGPSPDVVRALLRDAEAGRAPAVAAVHRVAVSLGRVVVTLATLLDPRAVVLGGSLAEVHRLAERCIADEIHASAPHLRQRDTVVLAGALGVDAALLGAAELAFRPLLGDPLAAA